MHRPLDFRRDHLRNAPNAEAAIGAETPAEEIGARVGVLWATEPIFVGPILKIVKHLTRLRCVDRGFVLLLIYHGSTELVHHRVWHEPEGGADRPIEVEPTATGHAVRITPGQLLRDSRQGFP